MFAVFFYSLANFSLYIEVANNLPFAKFYIACIQTHYVHTLCDSGRLAIWGWENKTHVYLDGFHIASVQWGPIDENVLPTLQNLEMTL